MLDIGFWQDHEAVHGKGGRSVRRVYLVGGFAFRRITDAECQVRQASYRTG